jgi:hypothetical protein
MSETDHRIAGRLYLDGQIVGVRSHLEASLISSIKEAPISLTNVDRPAPKEEPGATVVVGEDIADYMSAVRASPKAAIQHLVDSLVKFVESEEYVRLADKAADDDSA